jgi:signal transduction histidine kinase
MTREPADGSAGGAAPAAFPAAGGRMGERVRAHDWSRTPLGPVSGWPVSLRSVVNLVLELPTPAILYWGPGLTAIHNDAYAPLLGAKPAALGRSFREIWPEALDVIGPVAEKALSGEASRFERTAFTLRRRGHPEQAWFDWAYSPVRDESGAVVGFLNTTIETTDGVLAERRQAFVLELTDRLRNLAAPAEIQREVSQLLGQRLGASRVYYAEVDEADNQVVIHSEYRDPASQSTDMAGRYPFDDLARTLTERVRSGETVVVHDSTSDDRLTPAERGAFRKLGARAVIAAPLVKRGRLLALLAVLQAEPWRWSAEEVRQTEETAERTWSAVERGRAEAALQQAKRAAEDAGQAKSRLLAILSHELRTPLTGVVGSVDFLETASVGSLEAKQAQAVKRIKDSAWQMVAMIDEILMLARTDAGKEEVRLERTDLAMAVRQAVGLVEDRAEERGLSIRIEDVDPPAPIETDPGKVRQILTNLLGNAIKFTPQGEVVVALDRSHPTSLAIHIRDTGPGIAPADQERIFEPFVRAHGDREDASGPRGAGLGLAICRRFARLLGGDVTVESSPGAGSTFTLILPLENPSA